MNKTEYYIKRNREIKEELRISKNNLLNSTCNNLEYLFYEYFKTNNRKREQELKEQIALYEKFIDLCI